MASSLISCKVLLGLALLFARTSEAQTIRVGVLQYGSVDWLVDVIKDHKLDEKEGFTLRTTPLASNNAAHVALLGGEADAVLTDWFWVLRQRAIGEDFVFFPYLATQGAVMAPPGSPINSVTDLKGRKIGVAGSPLDKSWLMLRAYGLQLGIGDLNKTADPVFAAPPLLDQQLKAGRLDAVLNFWHYAAPLESAGYKRVISIPALVKGLGIDTAVPILGFVFRQALADRDPVAFNGFARAVMAAQKLLVESDAEWDRLRPRNPRMKDASDSEFRALRQAYREGRLEHWGVRERQAAAKLFDILIRVGGPEVVGEGVQFDEAVFWKGPVL